MFDLTSSKLLILAVVALIVVGPKDLPALMRTVGRYLGMIKRQANEFRAQFEDAMRESELSDLKKEVEQLGEEARGTLHETTSAVESHMSDVTREMNAQLSDTVRPAALTADADSPSSESGSMAEAAEPTPSLSQEAVSHEPAPNEPAAPDPEKIVEAPEPATSSRSGA
jgi:sec-independent protein translocase protein TatB